MKETLIKFIKQTLLAKESAIFPHYTQGYWQTDFQGSMQPKGINNETFPLKTQETRTRFLNFLMELARDNKFPKQEDLKAFLVTVQGVCSVLQSVPWKEIVDGTMGASGTEDETQIKQFVSNLASNYQVQSEEQKKLCIDSVTRLLDNVDGFAVDLLKSETNIFNYMYPQPSIR